MRTPIVVLTALSLLTFAVPLASAGPECLQVYPWSELCQGDVEGFLHGMGVGVVEPCLKDCVSPPTVDCIQAYPWSELCQGDVVSFVCYYAKCDSLVLA